MKIRTTVVLPASIAAALMASWSGDAPAQQARAATQERPEASRRQAEPRVDPQADQLLRRMSDYLKGLQAFTVVADHETEVVRDSGQKIQFLASSKVAVRRPNKFRSDRAGQIADMSFYYDGKHLTLYGARTGYYATADAPPTIDGAVDFARDRIEIEIPGSDLLYADPYRALMDDVVSGIYVGEASIDGVPVQHLAYEGHDTDWQIWIEADATPLPRKYVIVTKDMKSQPEFAVELHDWDVAPKLSDATFEFKPPPGAHKIEFLGMRSKGKQESAK